MSIKRKKFNVSLLGESEVGKTCMAAVLTGIGFNEKNLTTIGMDTFLDKAIIEGQEYKFKIFDTNGQERYNSITDTTIKLADGYLLVFSIDKRSSFEKVQHWIEVIENSVDMRTKAAILVGNKIDKENREVTNEEAMSFAKARKMFYLETSAKTGFQIKEAFNKVYEEIYRINIGKDNSQNDNGNNSNDNNKKNNKIQGNIEINRKDLKKNEDKKCC